MAAVALLQPSRRGVKQDAKQRMRVIQADIKGRVRALFAILDMATGTGLLDIGSIGISRRWLPEAAAGTGKLEAFLPDLLETPEEPLLFIH